LRLGLRLTLDFAVDIGTELFVCAAVRRDTENRLSYWLWVALEDVCRSWGW